MIILGIDPGTNKTGYGLIRVVNGKYQAIDYGVIKPPSSQKLTDRYLIIYEAIDELIKEYEPAILSVETQFVQKNIQSAIKLGMARGIAILAAKKKRVPVYEYAPTKAKLAVVGNGRASKEQVGKMVQYLLSLPEMPSQEDAADALALAICHAQSIRFSQAYGGEI